MSNRNRKLVGSSASAAKSQALSDIAAAENVDVIVESVLIDTPINAMPPIEPPAPTPIKEKEKEKVKAEKTAETHFEWGMYFQGLLSGEAVTLEAVKQAVFHSLANYFSANAEPLDTTQFVAAWLNFAGIGNSEARHINRYGQRLLTCASNIQINCHTLYVAAMKPHLALPNGIFTIRTAKGKRSRVTEDVYTKSLS